MTKNSSTDKKSSNVNITNVRKLLKKVVFNPNSPGPLQVVSQTGNPSYFETRALEYVEEARLDRMEARNLPIDNIMEMFQDPREQYKQKLTRAMQMLLIAMMKVDSGEY